MTTGTTIPNFLASQLRRICGDGHVLTDPDVRAPFETDWTRRFHGRSAAVVRPGNAQAVSEVVAACAGAGVAVVPQGGNTGLVGGSVPALASGAQAAVIVSTRRLTGIKPVDPLSGQITVQAGVTLATVQASAKAAGWLYGVDLAARDSATIGGTVATNAGGTNVIAYGMTRANLTGIEAVLPDGTVISHLQGLLKDNTGYDLTSLLCGSEGTLGIITAVRLRLHRPHAPTTVALIGVSNFGQALELMAAARAGAAPVIAAEVIDAAGIELVCAVTDVPQPLTTHPPLVVLLELADGGDGQGLAFISDDLDMAVATDVATKQRLWAYRERQSEAYASLGVIHKFDLSIPLANLAQCADGLRQLVSTFSSVTHFGMFGHIADGNMHIEIAGPARDDRDVDHAVLAYATSFGGSISAEHGIGRAKADELHLCRSAAEIGAMRAIKDAWDPRGLMHPGVLFAQT